MKEQVTRKLPAIYRKTPRAYITMGKDLVNNFLTAHRLKDIHQLFTFKQGQGQPDIHDLCAKEEEVRSANSATRSPYSVPLSEYFKLAVGLLYISLAHFATAVVTVIMNDRALDLRIHPTLPDIVMDVVPLTPWANSACEVITLSLAAVNIINVAFHKYRIIILRRFCFLAGTMYFFRCITLFMTVLPTTSDQFECNSEPNATWSSQIDKIFSRWRSAGLSVQGGHACGDYMFSGHALIVTMLLYFTLEYTPYLFLHILAWISSLFALFCILAAHDHYTIDVLVAFLFTSGLFTVYHAYADCPVSEIHHSRATRLNFPCFSLFEPSLPEGKVPNEYNISWFRGHFKSEKKDS